jgi:hypothetical protein
MLCRAAVNAGDVWVDPFEHAGGDTPGCPGPLTLVWHRRLLHTGSSIREQGGGTESNLPNGIMRVSPRVSPLMRPPLPGPRSLTGSGTPLAGRPRFPDATAIVSGEPPPAAASSVSDAMRGDLCRVGRSLALCLTRPGQRTFTSKLSNMLGTPGAMETTERFPQRLGNLAHHARFPHSHSRSFLSHKKKTKRKTYTCVTHDS